MSFIITTKLSSDNEAWTSLKCVTLSISLIKERLAVLEGHEYMGVPSWEEGDDPKVIEEIEMLHKQIHHLRKFKVGLVEALEMSLEGWSHE